MLAGINHRDAELGDESHGAIGLSRFEFGFGDFLGEREVFFVGFEDAKSKFGGIFPIVGLHVEVEKELSVLAAFFEAGQIFQDFGSASVIALRGVGTRFNGNGGDVRGIELQGFIGQLFALRVVGASQSTLRS